MDLQPPPSYSEIQKGFRPITNVNKTHRQALKEHERFALWITKEVGSMGFFTLIFLWTACWLVWNIAAPIEYRFDPYPAFVMWLFISNLIQLMLMPLIMVGQNLEARHSEARAEADFHINTKSEKEIALILEHLEYQNGLIAEILEKQENK